MSISSTLPCFKTFAGLNGPSNSFSSLTTDDLTGATEGTIFPLENEGPVFIVGALKVNPDDGEKDGGLAAVALTIGEENVKGTDGGVDGAAGSLFAAGSSETVISGVVLDLREEVGGGEEKLNVGKVKLLGREAGGRSGSSATSSSGRLIEGLMALSLFILPPPKPALLAAGVLDKGYDKVLVLGGGAWAGSEIGGDCLTGVSLLVFSTPLFTPPGVSDGLKDIERLPDTAAAAGTTSFCTGGTDGSSLFLFAW